MDKPYADGQWTNARMRSFVIGLLRKGHMRWRPKHLAFNKAFIKDGPNPRTGRKCKLHKCEISGDLFAKGDMHADHIEPAIPISGEWGGATSFLGYNWNELIPRMFSEKEGYQIISKEIHKKKTKEENTLRHPSKRKSEVTAFRKLSAEEQGYALIRLCQEVNYQGYVTAKNATQRVALFRKLNNKTQTS